MSIIAKTTNRNDIEFCIRTFSTAAPTVAIGTHEFALSEVCNYAARSLIFGLTKENRLGIAERIDKQYKKVEDYSYSRETHELERILLPQISQDDVGIAGYRFHKNEFDTVAQYLLAGGEFGYNVIQKEILAARQAVTKVARDEALWALLGKASKNAVNLSLNLIGLKLCDTAELAERTINKALALDILPDELKSFLQTNYFSKPNS